jgi:hypothetical protein
MFDFKFKLNFHILKLSFLGDLDDTSLVKKTIRLRLRFELE